MVILIGILALTDYKNRMIFRRLWYKCISS